MEASSLIKKPNDIKSSVKRKQRKSRSRNNSIDIKFKKKPKKRNNLFDKERKLKIIKVIQPIKKQINSSSTYAFKLNDPLCTYAYNSFEGTTRDYNEDTISIETNIPCPINKDQSTWPIVHFFAIYDGHGGNKCSLFLQKSLKKYVIENNYFPKDPKKALLNAFAQAEEEFISEIKPFNMIDTYDKSGSCALVLIIIDDFCYCASTGDSNGFYYQSNNKTIYQINQEHKVDNYVEKERIELAGGSIYQKTPDLASCSWRLNPGKLAISRSLGDFYAKSTELGGNPDVLIAIPEITSFKITNSIDFIVLGSDGIHDTLNQKRILKIIGKYMQSKITISKENYPSSTGEICDLIMKKSMDLGSIDNISCVIITLKNFFTSDFSNVKHWKEDGLLLLPNNHFNKPNYQLYSLSKPSSKIIPSYNNTNIAKMTSEQNYRKRFSFKSK